MDTISFDLVEASPLIDEFSQKMEIIIFFHRRWFRHI